MLKAFLCPPFYMTYVQPPSNAIQLNIHCNLKFYPYFCNAIRVINGCHIPVSLPSYVSLGYCNQKGFFSQNRLFIYDFDLHFTYVLTDWEGSASDACVYRDVIALDLQIPTGKYLLADAGFPLCSKLLVPFCGV